MTLEEATNTAAATVLLLVVAVFVGTLVYVSWPAVLIIVGLGVLILLAFGALTLFIWAAGNLYARLRR